MGSLMAGWSSPSKDFKSEKLQRNKSLIKDEIEAYWKMKKISEEERPANATILAPNEEVQLQKISGGSANVMQRSISFPPGGDQQKSNCWWMRSNLAFLNEPPVKAMEGPSYKYAAQYHVAELGRAKTISNPEMMSY